MNQMEKKQGNTKECPDDGITIHFYIITFLLTLLSCSWFLWNYEARQFLYRKMATACVCSRFKRRFLSIEIRPGTTIAHQKVSNKIRWKLMIFFIRKKTYILLPSIKERTDAIGNHAK